MWETEIICSRRNIKCIEYIHKNLSLENEVITALICDAENIYLSIACKTENIPKIRAKLTLLITDAIINFLKFDFLSLNIDALSSDEVLNFALIKICALFDSELDREIILQNLTFKTEKFNLEGFFHFKLPKLKDKWMELCELTNKNMTLFLNKNNFLELLTFLLKNIESKIDTLIIDFSEQCIVYYDNMMQVEKMQKINLNDTNNILGIILELNPKLIKIYTNAEYAELIKYLKLIFTEKLIFAN